MEEIRKFFEEATRLRRMYEASEEPLPKPEELVKEAIHNLQTHEAISADTYKDVYLKTLEMFGKQAEEMAFESRRRANGSLMRSRYLAFSISYVRIARKALWDSTQPLFPTGVGDESLSKALDQVWTWIQASPKVERYKESVVTEVETGGLESTIKRSYNLLTPMAFPKPIENQNQLVETPLPFTYHAYLLSDAVDKFIDRTTGSHETSWWQPEWTAVYLTTGYFKRAALPRWEVTADIQTVVGRSRGCTYIKVHDVASVSPSELADVYTRTRIQMTEQRGVPKFEITSGRPEEYSTEVLAQLELELILKKAEERRARGESVRPEVWNERPGYKELETAWREKAAAFGVDPEKRLTPQSLSNFRSRVRRDLYEPALSHMWTEEDNQKTIEAVDHNRSPVINIFDGQSEE